MAETPEVPAQAAPETTGTAPVVEAPVSGDIKPVATTETVPEKKFTQEDMDRVIAQRLARQARQLEQKRTQPEPTAPATETVPPKPEDFESTQQYIHAAAKYEAKQIVEQTLAQRETQTRESRQQEFVANVERTYRDREDKVAIARPDYESVVYENPQLVITDHMALTIKQSDNGPDVAYHLGKNPQEAARIARLHPLAQAMEIGKLGVKLSSEPAPARPTSAPQPIPVAKPSGTAPVLETTDPRSTKSMTTSEWIDAERNRQRRVLEARYR